MHCVICNERYIYDKAIEYLKAKETRIKSGVAVQSSPMFCYN